MIFLGIELYFDDLDAAKRFYHETLGLELRDESAGHHAKFNCGPAFLCLERKGSESYPSRDKAVLFFEVVDLRALLDQIGSERFVGLGAEEADGQIPWAVTHDPEGHNVVFIQSPSRNLETAADRSPPEP
jgi:catechol 2,3-dioxygenase-like lactoylglutathione lyase family enzyme